MTAKSKETPATQTPSAVEVAATNSLKGKLRALREHLLTDLVERDLPLRLALLGALAGEHLLLLGPPGTAKSELARRLRHAFRDANYFERLLTRFTVPEELFGPLSVKALEQDRYQRQTAGYLPNAAVAFLDEIFKANSAILNALLTLLNEREFDNGTQRLPTPLICVIGASNELPEGEELSALYDRFLLRCYVPRVSDDGFAKLLQLRGQWKPQPDLDLQLSPTELGELRTSAQRVKVPADVVELLKALRLHCIAQSIDVSERRWRKALFLLQVAAYTDGRNEVSQWDCWLLQHCLWQQPEQREALFDWYKSRVGAAAAAPDRFTKAVATWEKNLKVETESQTQVRDTQGQPVFLTKDNKPVVQQEGRRQRTNTQGEPLYVLPKQFQDRTNTGHGYTRTECINAARSQDRYNWENHLDVNKYFNDTNSCLFETYKLLPCMEPTRYSDAHVRGRVEQVKGLLEDINVYVSGLRKQIESIAADIAQGLWGDPAFAHDANAQLAELLKQHQAYAGKLAGIQKGFDALPRSAT